MKKKLIRLLIAINAIVLIGVGGIINAVNSVN